MSHNDPMSLTITVPVTTFLGAAQGKTDDAGTPNNIGNSVVKTKENVLVFLTYDTGGSRMNGPAISLLVNGQNIANITYNEESGSRQSPPISVSQFPLVYWLHHSDRCSQYAGHLYQH